LSAPIAHDASFFIAASIFCVDTELMIALCAFLRLGEARRVPSPRAPPYQQALNLDDCYHQCDVERFCPHRCKS
jgi:tRNA A37 threonylcarbamoyltransferase TsaD